MTSESTGRLPLLTPADLDPEQADLYQVIVDGPRNRPGNASFLADDAGHLQGPFNAMLHSPTVGRALQELGARLRYGGLLPDRSREIAILEVARTRRSNFEWYAHESAGRSAGLTDSELDAIFSRRPDESFSASEAIVREVAVSLSTDHDLDDDLFDRAREVLGNAALVELQILVGYYELLATSLGTWRTPLPEGTRGRFDE